MTARALSGATVLTMGSRIHTDSPVTMKPRTHLRTLLPLVIAAASLGAAPAFAQQPAPPGPAAPPPPPAAAPPVAMPAQAPDPIAAALAPRPGGLTVDEVARTVAKTKYSVRQKQEDLKAAAARVDQAFVNFFPRVSAAFTYTRLSEIPPISFGTGALVGTSQPGGVPIAPNVPPGGTYKLPDGTVIKGADGKPVTCPTTAALGCYGSLVGAQVQIPVAFNSYALTASIAVPVSDYVFRIAQGYSAASHNEKAAKLAAEAESFQAAADAKIAYYNWVRAKGGVIVAKEAIDQARAHVDDAKKAFAVGLASKADVLRIESQLAAAQQGHAEAVAFAAVAEEQLRTLIQASPDRVLEIGSDVMNEAVAPPADALPALQEQALAKRMEIRALDETIYSLKRVEDVTRAGYLPRIDAFADATYANPNQRFPFDPTTWHGTWDVGVRFSWTLNDTFTTIGAAAEAKARTQSLVEQKGALRDGLRLEVASAYADAVKGPPTVEAADRGLVAAEESLRVRRELFRNGKATSSELVDAEAELTRARLSRLNAHIGLLVAKAKLDHATGRDVPTAPAAE
jgi:outer membrane protein TolC